VLKQLPLILKFERRDDQLAATYSFDHRTWMSFEGYEFPRRKQSLAGFAAWSGDASNRLAARFVLLSSRESSTKTN
jgi:regulation of enolase protein 1 (concanavalin A-like superfamily)